MMICRLFHDCAAYMIKVSEWGIFTRMRRQAAIADNISGYLAAIEELGGLLNVGCSFISELLLMHIAGRPGSRSVA